MSKNMFHATDLIARTFEERGIKFIVKPNGMHEEILAGFRADMSDALMIVRYISSDNDNDVSVRIFGIIEDIPFDKRPEILVKCNEMNNMFRFLKFTIDGDGDLNAEFDFPTNVSDDCLGEVAFELFMRTMGILTEAYSEFRKVVSDKENGGRRRISGFRSVGGLD